mmetsp:Transcript_4961/g.21072  ORF Transcript_4961/g.21072 Transcript_4961/m.21072 type:complete len:201 (+) Transcript_4961:1114-1716(+)
MFGIPQRPQRRRRELELVLEEVLVQTQGLRERGHQRVAQGRQSRVVPHHGFAKTALGQSQLRLVRPLVGPAQRLPVLVRARTYLPSDVVPLLGISPGLRRRIQRLLAERRPPAVVRVVRSEHGALRTLRKREERPRGVVHAVDEAPRHAVIRQVEEPVAHARVSYDGGHGRGVRGQVHDRDVVARLGHGAPGGAPHALVR